MFMSPISRTGPGKAARSRRDAAQLQPAPAGNEREVRIGHDQRPAWGFQVADHDRPWLLVDHNDLARVQVATSGTRRRICGRRITCQLRAGYRDNKAIPYEATPGTSSSVAAIHVAPGVPDRAATKRWETAPMASAATAVRSAPWDLACRRSTSCSARMSGSKNLIDSARRSRSTRWSLSARPCKMLNEATRMERRYSSSAPLSQRMARLPRRPGSVRR